MEKEERLEQIKRIEELRNSRIICYITGDRKSTESNLNLTKQINDEVPRYLYEHLKKIGKVEKIDLFLYSRGGSTEVPKKIIDLLREYTKCLGIIIPFRAHSAATMIALGADEILMSEMSELSPIDPSITTPFNPANPSNQSQKIPIQGEAILSFRDSLIKEFGLRSKSVKIPELLAQQLHPVIIGSAYRARRLVKFIVQDFLKYHSSNYFSFLKTKKIIKTLIRSSSHSLIINLKEAKSLGLNVKIMSDSLKESVWDLYNGYEKECKIQSIFNPMAALSSQQSVIEEFPKAFLESTERTDICMARITVFLLNQQQRTVRWVVEENWINQ